MLSSSSSSYIYPLQEDFGEQVYYGPPEDDDLHLYVEPEVKKHIEVGDYLPYGPRLYYGSGETIVRMKDFGEHSRILLLGVLGSFTPVCWNRHLFMVLQKLRYFEERSIDYICCVSTNDPFTQMAWGEYLCCQSEIFMLGDPTKRFTKAMGMDVVLPWLNDSVRSRRYLIFAENMLVTKMILPKCDETNLEWQCEHLIQEEIEEDDYNDDSDYS